MGPVQTKADTLDFAVWRRTGTPLSAVNHCFAHSFQEILAVCLEQCAHNRDKGQRTKTRWAFPAPICMCCCWLAQGSSVEAAWNSIFSLLLFLSVSQHFSCLSIHLCSVISQARGLLQLTMRFLAIGTFLGSPLDGALENQRFRSLTTKCEMKGSVACFFLAHKYPPDSQFCGERQSKVLAGLTPPSDIS